MARKPAALQLADPANPDFLLADSPLYWLARVSGRYRLDMDLVLKPIGMDVPRWRVLAILSEHEPASVTELCDHAVIRLSTMTRIVQRLADAGLVTTRQREADGRVTEVRLTDAGRDAAVSVHTQASRIFRHGFQGFSADEVTALNAMLKCCSSISGCRRDRRSCLTASIIPRGDPNGRPVRIPDRDALATRTSRPHPAFFAEYAQRREGVDHA